MEPSVTLRAPAKLNLTLEVLSKGSGGHHNLRSVMVPLDLHDELRLEPGASGVRVRCNLKELEQDNIVERALRAIDAGASYDAFLGKDIPVGGGLGGGSSDAAAVLLAAASGRIKATKGCDYPAIARALGSDVPFFLTQGAALVEGTGERVTALANPPLWFAVILVPPVRVSSAQAYARLHLSGDRTRERTNSASIRMGEAVQRGDFKTAASLLSNDFQSIIADAYPAVAHALAAFEHAGTPGTLTGSGACVFALCEDRAAAESLATRLQLPPGHRVLRAPLLRAAQWANA